MEDHQELKRLRSLTGLRPSPAVFLALHGCPGMKRRGIKEPTAQENGGDRVRVGDAGLRFDTDEGLREVFSQLSLPTREESKTGGFKLSWDLLIGTLLGKVPASRKG